MPNLGRFLGVDVGSARIGVAVSDPLGLFAQPLETIERRRCDALARLRQLVASYEVSTVVVGLPVRLDGSEGPAVASTRAFADKLRAQLEVSLVWWDERLSTAQAERIMLASGARRAERRGGIDRVAAAIILQSYMDAQATGRLND